MGETNESKIKTAEITEISDKKLTKNDKPWLFKNGPDPRRNLAGKPPGTKSFDTIFEEAIKEIVKSKKLPIKDPEKELMIKGIIEALKGNHNFWKSISEWRYGKPKETFEAKIGILDINQLLDDINSNKYPKIE